MLAVKQILLSFMLGSATLFGQQGSALYGTHCAACHDAPAGRTPPLSALRAMTSKTIMQALTNGPMKPQAAGLSSGELHALVAYLAAAVPSPEERSTAAAVCKAGAISPRAGAGTLHWLGWGADFENRRFVNTSAAGMTAADVPNLKLKWAFGLGEGTSVHSQPAVGGVRVFTATLTGVVDSLDSRDGCIQWAFKASAPVRSGIVVGETAGSADESVYFGDQQANAYAVDGVTGQLRWKTHVGDHLAALITGTPLLHGGVLYVPVSSYEEALAGSPRYECCTFRGGVVALDAATGKRIWQSYTIRDASKPTEKSKSGTQMHGPSGAAVWSAPTYDEKLNLLYVSTGDNYSQPATTTSDAVLALDAKTGEILWSRQVTPDDIYNMGSYAKGRDFDFGQPPILVSLPAGRRALVIGQKSGVVHALDPDRAGAILWHARVGQGGPLGGSQWGSAADVRNMYVAVSDLKMKAVPDKSNPQGYRLELDPRQGGGLFALRLLDGTQVWSAEPEGCGERQHCSPAQSAAVSAIPGVVFSGSLDGHLRAYSADSGRLLWDVDTVRAYKTVNGQQARGGSLDIAGPVISDGVLYVNSGYAQWGGLPGNVLLAFSVNGN